VKEGDRALDEATTRVLAAIKKYGSEDAMRRLIEFADKDLAEKLQAAKIKIVGLEGEIEDLKRENADLRRQLEATKTIDPLASNGGHPEINEWPRHSREFTPRAGHRRVVSVLATPKAVRTWRQR